MGTVDLLKGPVAQFRWLFRKGRGHTGGSEARVSPALLLASCAALIGAFFSPSCSLSRQSSATPPLARELGKGVKTVCSL